MNFYVFIFGLAIIIISSILISLKTKNENSSNDFFLGSRNIGFVSLVFTLIATQLGGGAILGACNEAYKAGPYACLYTLGQSLGLIILSFGIGNKFRNLNVLTISEIFETKFDSKFLRKFTSLISVCSLFGILVSMAISSRSFIKAIGIDTEYILIIFWLILVFYTTIGGLKAVIYTDIIQAIILLTILYLVLLVAIYKNPQSLKTIITKFDYNTAWKIGKREIFGWFLMPFLFTFVEQDLAQRFFSAKSSKVIFYSSIVAALTLILTTVIPIFFGMIASISNFSVNKYGSIFITSIIKTTNPTISGLAACAVLAAIISTADSVLMGISSNICNDFNLIKTQNNMLIPKIITSVVGISALLISFYFDNIISVLIKSYELSICCILVPTIMATLGYIKNKKSALVSVAFGLISFTIFCFVNINFPNQIISIIASLIGYLLFYTKNN